MSRRKRPYTAIGIRRLRCWRRGCHNRAQFQWQVCADGNAWRPICGPCDIALNAVVLKFIGDPRAKQKMAAYRRRFVCEAA